MSSNSELKKLETELSIISNVGELDDGATRNRARPNYFHEDNTTPEKKKYKQTLKENDLIDTDNEEECDDSKECDDSISIQSSSSEENEFDEDEADDLEATERYENNDNNEDDDNSFISMNDDHIGITNGTQSVLSLSNSVTREKLESDNPGVGEVAQLNEMAHHTLLDEYENSENGQIITLDDIDNKRKEIKTIISNTTINNNIMIFNNNTHINENRSTTTINNYHTTINNNAMADSVSYSTAIPANLSNLKPTIKKKPNSKGKNSAKRAQGTCIMSCGRESTTVCSLCTHPTDPMQKQFWVCSPVKSGCTNECFANHIKQKHSASLKSD